MSKAEIYAGICGFSTVVEASMSGNVCNVVITSDCKAIQQLAQVLTHVDPFQEISFKQAIPQTIQLCIQYCTHAACPVGVGIIKAIEVEAQLALPADVSIKLSTS